MNNAQTAQAGTYTVVVSNTAGSVTSAAATLTVSPAASPPDRPAPPIPDAAQWCAENGGNGHWYKIVTGTLSWDQARAAAEERGGYLATIASKGEHDFIIKSVLPTVPQSPARSGVWGWWLGGARAAGSTSWRWITGESLSYADWGPGEPNAASSTQAWLGLFSYDAASWNGADYFGKFDDVIAENAWLFAGYIVEVESGAGPESPDTTGDGSGGCGGRNLLVNPGFEDGLSGWVTNGAGLRRSNNLPVPHGGSAYLYGGTTGETFTHQTIVLSDAGVLVGDIDSGQLTSCFGGWQAGWENQRDQGRIELLASGAAGVLSSTDLEWSRSDKSWTKLEGQAALPKGARTIRFGFRSQRFEGANNDGYLDDAFLTLQPTSPEPGGGQPTSLGGTLDFNNRIPGTVDARVLLPDGSGAGTGWTAELLAGPEGGPLSPVTPTTTFRSSSADAMGYVNPIQVTVPNVAPAAKATVVLRAFNGASFEASTLRGQSKAITVVLGGTGVPPSLPANLVGLEGFTVGAPQAPRPTAEPFVLRELPGSYAPDVRFTVTLRATPRAGTGNYAVEDQPPAGWLAEQINESGFYDAGNHKVKWGPFFDSNARTLTYAVTPPAGTAGEKTFAGSASADGASSATGGMTTITVAQLHPADNNPANGRMGLDEVTAYGAAWKKGQSWPAPPNPIAIDYVTRAGSLWKKGETYLLDSSIPAPPLWWVNAPAKAGLLSYRRVAQSASVGSAAGSLAPVFVPGEPLVIAISVQPSGGVSVYAVQDQVPEGWNVVRVSDSGAFDQSNRLVKWGPFFDNQPRQLSYEIVSAANSAETAVFEGTASFDGASSVITGQRHSRATSRLGQIRQLPSGELQLSLYGRLGAKYVIEASSNLVDWTTVGEVTNTDGTLVFKDEGGASAHRFYRVVSP